MNVTFHAPAIGRTHVSMGISGPGEVSWSADGIRIKGHLRSQTLAHALGCLGVIAAFGGGIALIVMLDIEVSGALGKGLLAGMLGVAAALIWLGRGLARPVPIPAACSSSRRARPRPTSGGDCRPKIREQPGPAGRNRDQATR
jgi:hypothetical protein